MGTRAIIHGLKKISPVIVTVLTAVGVCTTTYLAAKAGMKAEKELEKCKNEELALEEKVRIVTPIYIPAVCSLITTLTSIAIGRIIDKKLRTEAYVLSTTAYKMLEKQRKSYNNHISDDVVKKIRPSNIAEAKKTWENRGAYFCGMPGSNFEFDEDMRTFYDTYSNQYFKATVGQVLRSQLWINREYAFNGEVCLKKWYDTLGIPAPNDAKNEFWQCEDDYYFVDFDNYIITLDDGMEIGVISFGHDPHSIN